MLVFLPIECCCLLPLLQQNALLPYETETYETKTETSTKCVQNVALYNPHDVHRLECSTCELTLVMHSITTINLHDAEHNMLFSAHNTTGEYVAHFITSFSSLFQKVILLRNALTSSECDVTLLCNMLY